MKRFSNILIFSLFALAVHAQEKNDIMYITFSNGEVVSFLVDEIDSITFEAPAMDEVAPSFPADDGSKKLTLSNPAQNASNLLVAAGIACTDTMGRINITPEQYEEIKQFTSGLVSGSTRQKEIYKTCFDWICSNIKYGTNYSDGSYVNNDPYPVFTKKTAVCQGYSNLLFVMLHSQGVPVLVTNGYLDGYGVYGGHAWNYVNCDDKWYVSDPTNGGSFEMLRISTYSHLKPISFDVLLFEEQGCGFDYNESRLNICKVTTKSRYFVTPFSVGGYQVSSFNPTSEISPTIRELYIGKNIESFGENSRGLELYAPNVEYAHIDPENPTLRSNKGIVYSVYSDYPMYIPAAMKRIEMLPLETIGKNVIYNHNGVEEIVIPNGCKLIEPWAVENCPNLKKAYVPKETDVKKNAFYNVHPDFEIIYTD